MATILVVDDDPKFLLAAELMLATAGYSVLRALDGKEALDTLEKKHAEIDLTIIDLGLPGINGFELIGALSRRPNTIKVIATTGFYKDFHLEMAGTLGAHATIRKPPVGKPIPEEEWLRTIRGLIHEPQRDQLASVARAQGKGNTSEPSNGTETDR